MQTLSSETFQIPSAKVTEILKEKKKTTKKVYLTQEREKISF